MVKKLVTLNGEEHGLMQTLPNSNMENDFKYLDPSLKELKKKEQKEDSKLVRARYINHEYREGGRLEKPYCRYSGEPIQLYRLIHDHVYELPYGFVKEVNEGKIPVRSDLQSVDGRNVNSDGSPLKKDTFRREHELVPISFK